jgi:hypothetical protein
MGKALNAAVSRAYKAIDDLAQAQMNDAVRKAVQGANIAVYLEPDATGIVVLLGFEHPEGDLDILRKTTLRSLMNKELANGPDADYCLAIAAELEAIALKFRRAAKRA